MADPALSHQAGLFAGGGEILRLARPASRFLRSSSSTLRAIDDLPPTFQEIVSCGDVEDRSNIEAAQPNSTCDGNSKAAPVSRSTTTGTKPMRNAAPRWKSSLPRSRGVAQEDAARDVGPDPRAQAAQAPRKGRETAGTARLARARREFWFTLSRKFD